jgi:hypothetical protein
MRRGTTGTKTHALKASVGHPKMQMQMRPTRHDKRVGATRAMAKTTAIAWEKTTATAEPRMESSERVTPIYFSASRESRKASISGLVQFCAPMSLRWMRPARSMM